MRSLKTQSIAFVVILFSLAAIAPSCGDIEEPIVTDEQNIDDIINGYATDQISHTHVIGGDPCPQNITSKVLVFCYKTQEVTDCTADSVVITNPSAGLTATIAGQSSASFTSPQENLAIDLTFTCAIAQSFKHSYKLVFYKDGVKVDEEEAVVDVTVK